MARTDTTTIIVGAGPAGVSLAYLLASRGVSVTLLEQHTDFSRAFRGEILLPSGFEALQQMGLTDLVARIPHSSPATFELYANGDRVFHLRMSSQFFDHSPLTALSQPAFLEAVVNATRSFPCFRLELGATVTGLDRTNGRVSGVNVRTQAGTRTLQGNLVIGTDGRHSIVRTSCRLDSEKHGLDFDVIWFKMPAPDFSLNPTTFRGYVGRAQLLLIQRRMDSYRWRGSSARILMRIFDARTCQRGSKKWHSTLAPICRLIFARINRKSNVQCSCL